jgi:hypothetical protein
MNTRLFQNILEIAVLGWLFEYTMYLVGIFSTEPFFLINLILAIPLGIVLSKLLNSNV